MASLARTTKRVAKHPTTRRVGWIVAAAAAAAAAVTGIIVLGNKSAAAATPPSGSLTGPASAPTLSLAPGDMGGITLHAATSAPPYAGAPIMSLQVQPPSSTGGGGRAPLITNSASSNQNVIQDVSTQAGASSVSLSVFGLGTTTMTFMWLDAAGTQQTSTVVVTVVSP